MNTSLKISTKTHNFALSGVRWIPNAIHAERLIAVERPAQKIEAIVERDGFCI
jgi:hypothetical protein